MAKYEGFQLLCRCRCFKCGRSVLLEGYADADGTHYCPFHNDYVKTIEPHCKERTPKKVTARQARIDGSKLLNAGDTQ